MPTVTIGLLRLTDAATVIVAKEMGFFADLNIDVRLSVEPSWANVADKLAYRKLDAAVMLPPLALAATLGLRGAAVPLIVPMSLSLNGNSVTVTKDIAQLLADRESPPSDPIELGHRLKFIVPGRPRKPRFAVVHAFSTHNLLLRYWLGAVGIDPDKDVELVIIPPADMVDALRNRQIDGFCAGAPWGEMAARTREAETIMTSSQIWRNHPEKCFAVRSDWAQQNPAVLELLLRGLLRAAQFCDMPKNAPVIATLLARQYYLNVEPAAIRVSLPGAARDGSLRHFNVDTSVFFANAANFPWRSHAFWFIDQMARWGYLARDVDASTIGTAVYRPDLYRAAAALEGLPAPRVDMKPEGAHDGPWSVAGDPADIGMAADRFCDGCVFDPAISPSNETPQQSREA